MIQRQHNGPPELAQFQRQLEMALQTGGIDHLDDQVGRGEGCGRAGLLVHRDRRALVTPEQIFQCGRIVALQMMQGVDTRQIDHAGFIEADLHGALAIDAMGAGQFAGMRRGARHGVEQGRLAAARQTDQGDAQPPLATEQRGAQGDGSFCQSGLGFHHLPDL